MIKICKFLNKKFNISQTIYFKDLERSPDNIWMSSPDLRKASILIDGFFPYFIWKKLFE